MTSRAAQAADPALAIAGYRLRPRRLGLESQHEAVVLMHKDCPVCRSEGFASRTRVELHVGDRHALATLYQVGDGFIQVDEAGLSEAAWAKLQPCAGEAVTVVHPHPLQSLAALRTKLYGHRLGLRPLRAIMNDVVEEHYSDVELAAFVAAFSGAPFDLEETVALTQAMVEARDRLTWPAGRIADKHSIGGLPGNRTTPIIVAIAAAAGLIVPKTSSRAITSPAGTADVMETMTKVDLDLPTMRKVVERQGACLAWGGNVRLSPADDIIIRVERALDVDCEAQLIASVLSKKIAAGSTHVLLDIPVGPTAKVRTQADAAGLGRHLVEIGSRFGLVVTPMITDGRQPVGRGLGPALEARDVLAVLRGEPNAPADLRDRALALAAALMESTGLADAAARAAELLDSGAAYGKFISICEAQGRFREPRAAPLTQVIASTTSGRIATFDNRLLARAAKLAGAPGAKTAGLELHVKLGEKVAKGQPLLTLHGETPGELAYARSFVDEWPGVIAIQPR